MDRFARLPPADREPFFSETAARLGVAHVIIEKDFWACWTLKHLFGLPERHRFLFRGGTSLSKAYGLIRRFSEDIDITIHRADLGFGTSREELRAMTGNERKRWLASLRGACEAYVAEELLPSITEVFGGVLGEVRDESWKLAVDPETAQTLLFEYPPTGLSGEAGYIGETVRIAMGAKGECEPSGSRQIRSYAAEEFQEEFEDPACELMTLAAERTFWEKVTALHAWYHRNNPQKAHKTSRHYYDTCMLSRSDVRGKALDQLDLLADVAEHKSLLFSSGWARYDEARPGMLRLVPQSELRGALERDYENMRLMFFDEPPPFAEVIAELEALESEINAL